MLQVSKTTARRVDSARRDRSVTVIINSQYIYYFCVFICRHLNGMRRQITRK
jgi:hypothetical protein